MSSKPSCIDPLTGRALKTRGPGHLRLTPLPRSVTVRQLSLCGASTGESVGANVEAGGAAEHRDLLVLPRPHRASAAVGGAPLAVPPPHGAGRCGTAGAPEAAWRRPFSG